MGEIRCPQCNAYNRETARFCAECGALLRPTDRDGTGIQPAGVFVGEVAAQVGRIFVNRYRIDRELGRGGFGAVYAAWDLNLNHKCAVKENLGIKPEAQRQFTREATILANLSHPNLPRVTDHFSITNEGQYLVMDFVEGEDLESMVERLGKLEVTQTLKWAVQVADALIYLHNQQPPVLHRDIKPANIRITPADSAVLVDFGLVKIAAPQLKTTIGARAVTPGFAPPEQYGHSRTDTRTDIYALGATIYKLLTGRNPMESVMRISGGAIAPLREYCPLASAQVESTISRAMALAPAERFQTAQDFKDALQSCLEIPVSLPDSDRPVTRPSGRSVLVPYQAPHMPIAPAIPLEKEPKRKSPWFWVAIAGLGLASIVGISMLFGLFYYFGASATPTLSSGLGGKKTVTLESGKSSPGAANSTHAAELPIYKSKNPEVYLHLAAREPDTLDPALDYEVTGQGIISNIFDSLISTRKDDPNSFVPQLALEVPSIENGGVSTDGRIYHFRLRPGVKFQNGSLLTPEDVAYTFHRNMLQGGSDTSQWLFTEPLLGTGIYDVSYLIDPELVDDPDSLSSIDADQLYKVCQQVVDAVQVEGDGVVFKLAQPWSPFLATIASTYGSIISREWEIQNGAWDGDCSTWVQYYAPSMSTINKKRIGYAAMGTGPYKLDHWVFGNEIVLKANEDYWRQSPAWEGGPIGAPVIKQITIREVDDFHARLAQFQAGEADSIELESSEDWEKLDAMVGRVCSLNDQDCKGTDHPDAPLEMIRGNPATYRTDIFFNFIINPSDTAWYVGSGQLDGNGIPIDFFSNLHVRRAFAYCFNYESFMRQYLKGEGVRTLTVMLPGMPGYDPGSPIYRYDPERCAQELQQANFGGITVWDAGFKLAFPYPSGDQENKLIGEIVRDELTGIDHKFQVDVFEIASGDYYRQRYQGNLPLFPNTWIEDLHDPHNWLQPYSVGLYADYQNLPKDLRTLLGNYVNQGVAAFDPAARSQIYSGFNKAYYDNVPAILLYTGLTRHYQQRWVNGWYDNPVNPGLYYYVLRKD